MKTYKNTFKITLLVCLATIVLGGSIEYASNDFIANIPVFIKKHQDFCVNVCLGIFTSSLLLMVNAFVAYLADRERFYMEFQMYFLDMLAAYIEVHTEMKYKVDGQTKLHLLEKVIATSRKINTKVFFDYAPFFKWKKYRLVMNCFGDVDNLHNLFKWYKDCLEKHYNGFIREGDMKLLTEEFNKRLKEYKQIGFKETFQRQLEKLYEL